MNMHGRLSYPIGIFAAITLALVALSTAFLLWDLRARELMRGRQETAAITRVFLEQTSRTFESADLVLKGVQDRLQSTFGSQFTLDSLPVHFMLGTRVLEMRQLDGLFITDANGDVVNSSGEFPVVKTSVAESGYFKAFRAGESNAMYIDNPVRNPKDRSWTLYLSRPLPGPDGKSRGVIVGAIKITHFEEVYRLLQTAYLRPVSLYRANGSLIASLPQRESMIGERAPEIAGALAKLDDEVKFSSHVTGYGEREAFTLGRVPKYPLLVSVTDVQEEALAAWRETAVPIVIVAGVMSLFIIVAARLLSLELVRKQSLAQALLEANSRYHQTVESVMDAIIGVDQDQKVVLFNPAAAHMFGLEAEAAIGMPLEMLMPERLRGPHRMHVQGFAHSSIASRTMAPRSEIIGLRADGTEFPIESTISRSMVNGKFQLTAVLRDVTVQRESKRRLEEMNEQLRGLSASLQQVREQERTRIARELHDELGQQLTGLKLDLAWMSNRMREGRPPAVDRVDEMRHRLDGSIASVRRISSELRPLILDDLGFGEAVAWVTEEFRKRTEIAVSIDLPAVELVAGAELPTVLFRIVQESLTNIARHACAESVRIRLLADQSRLVLEISDDGIGFIDERRSGGFGLVSMRERADSLGGVLRVSSASGRGTTIRVEFPLELPIFEVMSV